MRRKLFNHICYSCQETYQSYDQDKVFCSTDCEAYFAYHKKSRRKPKQKAPVIKLVDQAQKWLDHKERVYSSNGVTLQKLMYRDTFKKHIPKALKVMRG